VFVYSLNLPAEHCMDLYILHTCPNIFLWLGLANSITTPDVSYTKFWGVFLFFMLPALEQNFIIKSFMHRLIRQTTQSKHITMEQLDVVWTVLKSVNATCVDPLGEEVLNLQGVGAFLKYVQQLTTGVKEDVPEYMVAALFELLDDDNSGFVTKSELFTYVSSVGLVIDLNGKPRGGESEKPKDRMLAKITTAVGLVPVSVTRRFSATASTMDLSNAERVIAELRDRDKNTSSALLAELSRSQSKVIKDLEAKAAAYSPVVVERSASRTLPLHIIEATGVPRVSSVKSVAMAADVEMAAPPPQRTSSTRVLVPESVAEAPEAAQEPEVEVYQLRVPEAAPADGEQAV
jgi:hypothetical protein